MRYPRGMAQTDTTANLQPFTKGDPRAVEAGRKGAEVRRANRARQAGDAQTVATELATLRASFERETLGPNAAAAAQWLIARVTRGDIPVRNGDEAAALLRAFVDVARLEAGEATAHSIHATIDRGEAVARVAALQARAREVLGAAAVAVDDAGHLGEIGAAVEVEAVSSDDPGGSDRA